MVKHPRYQAMDDARQKEIPLAFEEFCSKNFSLEIIPPIKEEPPRPGPIPRPAFRVLDQDKTIVAYFHPWGNSKCYREDFQLIFDKMNKAIEEAAAEALRIYEGH
ncbi:MAG: hypothetical protein ACFFDW_16370 [Candidatus Thorarchaeota archaeon]